MPVSFPAWCVMRCWIGCGRSESSPQRGWIGSLVLRAPDSEGRRTAYDSLVADLTVAAKVAKEVRR